MKKRIAATLSALILALFLLPTTALAADGDTPASIPENAISIAGTTVTDANKDNVLGDGTVSFAYVTDQDGNARGILTLTNANIVSDEDNPIDASDLDTLEIVLKGNSKITADEITCIVAVNLIFSGDGSLNAFTDGQYNYVIDCTGSFTVNSGNVFMRSVDYALCFDGALTVNSGTLELIATGESGTAIARDFTSPTVNLGSGMVMVAGDQPDGSDATPTTTSETGKIEDARYIKIQPEAPAEEEEPPADSHPSRTFSRRFPAGNTAADPTVADGTGVTSAKTGDAGIALYGAMALLSLSSGAWVVGKRKK